MTNQTIDPQYFKMLQLVANGAEQAFNKDIQINDLLAQNGLLMKTVRERDAELEKLRPKPAEAEKPPEPPAASAQPSSPSPTPSPAPSGESSIANSTSSGSDTEGGEAS